MLQFKVVFSLLALAVIFVQAKPSHPFGIHGVFDHLDLAPPVLPPTPFHAGEPSPVFPYHHHAKFLPPAHFHTNPLFAASAGLFPDPAPLLPAPAPLLPAPGSLFPAPAPLLPAPAPLLPAPVSFLPAPVPLLPAPTPLLPTPVIHTQTHIIPPPAPFITPFLEALPIAEPIPSYRAIPGPKTTTHHVSVGYAFPHSRFAKLHPHLHAAPHAHVRAHPLALAHHHHHNTIF